MNTRFKTTKFRDAGIKKLSQQDNFYCVTFLEDTVYILSLSSNSLPMLGQPHANKFWKPLLYSILFSTYDGKNGTKTHKIALSRYILIFHIP